MPRSPFPPREYRHPYPLGSSPYLTTSTMRRATPFLRASPSTQILLTPQTAGSGRVEQRQARCCCSGSCPGLCAATGSASTRNACRGQEEKWSCCFQPLRPPRGASQGRKPKAGSGGSLLCAKISPRYQHELFLHFIFPLSWARTGFPVCYQPAVFPPFPINSQITPA